LYTKLSNRFLAEPAKLDLTGAGTAWRPRTRAERSHVRLTAAPRVSTSKKAILGPCLRCRYRSPRPLPFSSRRGRGPWRPRGWRWWWRPWAWPFTTILPRSAAASSHHQNRMALNLNLIAPRLDLFWFAYDNLIS
jgi:hypothetical protein